MGVTLRLPAPRGLDPGDPHSPTRLGCADKRQRTYDSSMSPVASPQLFRDNGSGIRVLREDRIPQEIQAPAATSVEFAMCSGSASKGHPLLEHSRTPRPRPLGHPGSLNLSADLRGNPRAHSSLSQKRQSSLELLTFVMPAPIRIVEQSLIFVRMSTQVETNFEPWKCSDRAEPSGRRRRPTRGGERYDPFTHDY